MTDYDKAAQQLTLLATQLAAQQLAVALAKFRLAERAAITATARI